MIGSLFPAVVAEYDQDKRICRVRLDGLTDGGDVLLEAEILYPIGDKSQHTELEILGGDLVWVAFQGGDPRYPVICGSRAKNVGNEVEWRRYHHANIELNADKVLLFKSGDKVHVVAANVIVDAPKVTVNSENVTVNASSKLDVTSPQSTFSGKVTVNGLLTYTAGLAGSGASGGGGASAKIQGSIELTGGDVTADGIGLKAHKHTEHDNYSTSTAK